MNSQKVIVYFCTPSGVDIKERLEVPQHKVYEVFWEGKEGDWEKNLEKVVQLQPHLIILEGTAIQTTGIQSLLLPILKGRHLNIPILALLNFPYAEMNLAIEQETTLLLSGVDMVLFKPIAPKRLQARVASLLRRIV